VAEDARRGVLSATFRSLHHRNYRLFFFGQLASLIGTWMQTVAQLWLVYRLAGTGTDLGLVGFMGQFPVALMGPWGGVVADRFDRRRVLLVTQVLAMLIAAVMAALTLSGEVRIWHVYFLALSLGLVNGVDMPTRQSFVVDLVGKEDLSNAIALNSSIFNAARVLGPSLAGIVVAAVGEGVCFLLNALSFLFVIASLRAMRMEPRQRPERDRNIARSMVEGAVYVWSRPHIRAILIMIAVGSLTGMPYTVLLPIFAGSILNAGPLGLGLLSAAAGLGALCAALTLAARRSPRGLGAWVAAAACGFGLTLIGFSLSRNLLLSLVALTATGFCMVLMMAACNTLLQTFSPDHMRGRIMALFSMTFMGTAPFGAMLAGGLTDRIGAPWTVAGGGLLCLAAGLTMAASLPRLRRHARAEREGSRAPEA